MSSKQYSSVYRVVTYLKTTTTIKKKDTLIKKIKKRFGVEAAGNAEEGEEDESENE